MGKAKEESTARTGAVIERFIHYSVFGICFQVLEGILDIY
jgi:hypothetical protein